MNLYTLQDLNILENYLKKNGTLGPGRTFWVGNGVAMYGGSSGGDASSRAVDPSPLEPFATVDYAIGQCTASRGDNIIILPGHTESLTAASAITSDIAGVTIFGMGNGALRPTFTWSTNTAATWVVSAASCKFENLIFVNGIDQTATMHTVSAADVTFNGCEWRLNGTAYDGTYYGLIGITTTSSANRLTLDGCKARGSGTGAEASTARHTSFMQIVGGDGITVKNCEVDAKFQISATQLGAIDVQTTATKNLRIQKCFLANRTSTSTFAVSDTITGSTGLVDDCHFYVATGTTPISGATLTWGLNYYTTAAATSMGAV